MTHAEEEGTYGLAPNRPPEDKALWRDLAHYVVNSFRRLGWDDKQIAPLLLYRSESKGERDVNNFLNGRCTTSRDGVKWFDRFINLAASLNQLQADAAVNSQPASVANADPTSIIAQLVARASQLGAASASLAATSAQPPASASAQPAAAVNAQPAAAANAQPAAAASAQPAAPTSEAAVIAQLAAAISQLVATNAELMAQLAAARTPVAATA